MRDRLNVAARQRLLAVARGAGLLRVLERARFLGAAAEAAASNREFRTAHPSFAPPPLWWMHDMYGHAYYVLYWESGRDAAARLAALIDAHTDAERPRVADWGCGLARVLRHMPERYQRFGFDYNRAAVDWCAANIPGVAFHANGAQPPLPAADASFDALYALSVFTHLSEKRHEAWIAEIRRVLAPGGIFLGAFHMAPRKGQLLDSERARFDAGELVVRGGVKEGGRTYAAYHPESYVRERLLAGFDIVHGPEELFHQTLIVARKRG